MIEAFKRIAEKNNSSLILQYKLLRFQNDELVFHWIYFLARY